MNEKSSEQIGLILQNLSKVDAAIKAAESTLAALECDQESSSISVRLGGVDFQLTALAASRTDGRRFFVHPADEFNDLRQACIKAQKTHIFKLRSKAEGLRWQLREEAKKV